MTADEPLAGRTGVLLSPGQRTAGQDEDGKVCGKSVVLLIRRNRKEDQNDGRIKEQKPGGAIAELYSSDVTGGVDEVRLLDVEIDRSSAVGP